MRARGGARRPISACASGRVLTSEVFVMTPADALSIRRANTLHPNNVGHSGDPPRTRITLRPTHPFNSSAFADTEVVIEILIQFSLLGIEFRLASLFGLVCG